MNNKRKTTSYKYEYDYKNYFKTNNNSKDKEKKEKSKYNLYSNDIFNNNKSSKSDILFNLNFKYKSNNNKSNNKNDYISKSIKTYNTIFNSLRKINSTINSKDENDSWLLNSNTKNKIDIHHSNNNLSIKNNHQKNKTFFDKLKLNKDMSNNQNFQYVTSKSNFMDYKNINKNNETKAINRYNFKNNNYYYYWTNEENKNDNLNLNLYSFKKEANGSSKIIDNNILDKFSNNFDAIFNIVESKVKKKSNKMGGSICEGFNSKYKGKINFKKLNTKLVNPKLLSISQNVPKRSHLNKLLKESNKNNYMSENHFNFSMNKFNFIERLSEEKSPFKPLRSIFNKKKKYNNFDISDYNYNNRDNLNLKNNRRKLINLF